MLTGYLGLLESRRSATLICCRRLSMIVLTTYARRYDKRVSLSSAVSEVKTLSLASTLPRQSAVLGVGGF